MTYRLGTIASFLLIGSALIIDIIGFITTLLGIGLFLTPFMTLVFDFFAGFYLVIRGISLFDFRRSRSLIITWLLELLPGVGMLPLLTLGTWFFIRKVRKEDRERAIQQQSEEEGEFEQYQSNRMNSDIRTTSRKMTA